MKNLFWLIYFWPFLIKAQENNRGISWTEGLTWEQVKTKAKEENKFIFLDCYATWCGPCKAMKNQVYPLDSIGDYFNKNFISVKVQMDITKNDNAKVKAWYKDAEQLRKQFRVDAFPGFLFFSPNGTLVHKAIGYQTPGDFIATARVALKPGRLYTDPHDRYIQLGKEFLNGKISHDSAFKIQETLKLLGESQLAQSVAGELYKFLTLQPPNSLFTISRLKFISSITERSTDRWFSLFYKQSKRVNQVMKDDNYSQRLVGKIIAKTVVTPFLKMDMSGRMLANTEIVKKYSPEADWTGLKKEIRKQFNEYHTERSMGAARFIWYQLHFNGLAFAKAYFEYLDRYGINSHEWTSPFSINNFSYNIAFLQINDKIVLQNAIKWMRLVLKELPDYNHLDTYASLLYKVGDKEEALKWEKLALEKARQNEMGLLDVPFFESVIRKMERGEKLDWLN